MTPPRVLIDNWIDTLMKSGACIEAVEWAKDYTTPTAAWNACKRADWMLWFAVRIHVDRKLIVLAACACARTALKLMPKGEDRPLIAIKTAQAWARGKATIEEVRAASAAASAAADSAADSAAFAASAASGAAFAASAAAAAAGSSSGRASSQASASSAAASAAADYAAYAAAFASAADSAARSRSLKESADLVRKHISARRALAAWRNSCAC